MTCSLRRVLRILPTIAAAALTGIACSGAYVYDLNSKGEGSSSPAPAAGGASPAPSPAASPQSSSLKEAVGDAVLPLLDGHDTEYASGFKEEVFRSIPIGSSQEEVKRELGEPLSRKTFADGNTCWYYSRHGKKSKSYHIRVLEFGPDDRLAARRAKFYVD